MPAANGLFADGGWLTSPADIDFASQGAAEIRELKTELRDIFSCFLRTNYKGEFADDVIESRTLVDTGIAPGVYNHLTINSKGQATAGELKSPLGDPIHSPGGNGLVDCGDIPVPDAIYKGFTRVRIDEFGRVIRGDCVSPHTDTLPQTYDTMDVDQHGRVVSGVNNNLLARIINLESGGAGGGASGAGVFTGTAAASLYTHQYVEATAVPSSDVDVSATIDLTANGVPANAVAVQIKCSANVVSDDALATAEIQLAIGGAAAYTVSEVVKATVVDAATVTKQDSDSVMIVIDTRGVGAVTDLVVTATSTDIQEGEANYEVEVVGFWAGAGGAFLPSYGANINSGTASVGFTNIAIGAIPAGRTAVYLNTFMQNRNGSFAHTLLIKDSNGITVEAAIGSEFGSGNGSAIFIDVSGPSAIQYSVVNTVGGGDVSMSFKIDRLAWI